MDVVNVIKASGKSQPLLYMREPTLVRNPLNVVSVVKPSSISGISKCTRELTQVRNHTNVKTVEERF